jgi:hypothetical protein
MRSRIDAEVQTRSSEPGACMINCLSTNRVAGEVFMIRKLKSGGYRLYSRKVDRKSGTRRNLGTFRTRGAAEQHERVVQFFKHG